MYGQRLAKDLAGRLETIRYQLLAALADAGDGPPDDPFIDAALTAAFRIHQAGLRSWRYSQLDPDEIEPSDPEESSGQYDPPGPDPNPREQDVAMRLTQWLRLLEEYLLEAVHEALGETSAQGRDAFVDMAVAAAQRMGQARRSLADPSAG